jgi:hypothetical protein
MGARRSDVEILSRWSAPLPCVYCRNSGRTPSHLTRHEVNDDTDSVKQEFVKANHCHHFCGYDHELVSNRLYSDRLSQRRRLVRLAGWARHHNPYSNRPICYEAKIARRDLAKLDPIAGICLRKPLRVEVDKYSSSTGAIRKDRQNTQSRAGPAELESPDDVLYMVSEGPDRERTSNTILLCVKISRRRISPP